MKLKMMWNELKVWAAVKIFGSTVLFRWQCWCGASILMPLPEPLAGSAFKRGDSLKIDCKEGTMLNIQCDVCDRESTLQWNDIKKQFTIVKCWEDFAPDRLYTVRGENGEVIAEGVGLLSAKSYQDANFGSTLEMGVEKKV